MASTSSPPDITDAVAGLSISPGLANVTEVDGDITYLPYDGEHYLQPLVDLISVELSEPYSIFTYRYFLNNWPELAFLALMPAPVADLEVIERGGAKYCVVGTIVNKQDKHRSGSMRGYIAMLAVHKSVRGRGMGRKLVQLAVRKMRDTGADEAVLETEVTNKGALRLYEGLGFCRDKRLMRYYLNGNDAFRLKVWFNDVQYPLPPEEDGAPGDASPRPEGAPSDDGKPPAPFPAPFVGDEPKAESPKAPEAELPKEAKAPKAPKAESPKAEAKGYPLGGPCKLAVVGGYQLPHGTCPQPQPPTST